MLQVRKNEILLRSWSGGTAHLSTSKEILFTGSLKPKSNQETKVVFIRSFGPLFSLTAPQLQSDMFMLQADWSFSFDFGDVSWRQAEDWNLLLAGAVEVLMLRNDQMYVLSTMGASKESISKF